MSIIVLNLFLCCGHVLGNSYIEARHFFEALGARRESPDENESKIVLIRPFPPLLLVHGLSLLYLTPSLLSLLITLLNLGFLRLGLPISLYHVSANFCLQHPL